MSCAPQKAGCQSEKSDQIKNHPDFVFIDTKRGKNWPGFWRDGPAPDLSCSLPMTKSDKALPHIPRMPQRQLSRLRPNGKTMGLDADIDLSNPTSCGVKRVDLPVKPSG